MSSVSEPRSTPKGRRRREALVTAAAELLLTGGYDAVRHRSVAARARLPLASTTYYFDSLDDLVAHAAEVNGRRELDLIREQMRERAADGQDPVTLVTDLLIGPDDADDERHDLLVARYERVLAAARHPQLQGLHCRLRSELEEMVADALAAAGRRSDREHVRLLLALVDGLVLGALGEEGTDPRARIRDVLRGAVEGPAPLEPGGVLGPYTSAT
ncbi:TetR/AcrR family transcriptional regulator [Rhodococcoides corynebacterioides]|uniref:TetR/AcrR family transcriptional regulator n=1 Tax=Rhodococcoides corynebacterioides TaxID=53972 RepID=UPI00083478DC|nr:TetR family transcriptional regulator C-terminal domain-containing protein [Rhodococcus corynebacterioides]MBY6348886.1 TetR family transcriptional regulator C-terminal domain-containing protein [Rhodococcus corynebacterioides]MBY6361702.1 TetR family transcriptional regulator C-terminal domain-containing protein [Rhodococcus corynebacterioides]